MRTSQGPWQKWMAAAVVGLIGGGVGINPALAQPTLDDLLDLAPPPGEATPSPAPTEADDPAIPIDPEVQRRLSGQQMADAFEQAVAQMQTASLRLGRDFDPGLDTQRIQEDILDKLDRVIASARQMQQQSSSSSSSSSSGESSSQPRDADSGSQQNVGQDQGQDQASPPGGEPGQADDQQNGAEGTQSGDGPGGSRDAAAGDLTDITETRSEWGNLPPRLRSELLEGTRERFSPIYRSLTEEYYRRLAEEGK